MFLLRKCETIFLDKNKPASRETGFLVLYEEILEVRVTTIFLGSIK